LWGTVENLLEGGQSWPQPPFRRPEPAESRLRAELPALQLVFIDFGDPQGYEDRLEGVPSGPGGL